MKRTLLYVGSVFILILSAITFIFIPAMLQGTPKGLVFGKYDGKKIELSPDSDFAVSAANFTDLYKNQDGNFNDSTYFYIYNYAFNATVSFRAGADAVKKSGYEPSASLVSRNLLPYFSDERGNYSAKLYNATSESTRNSLKKDITKHLIWTRYYEDTFGTDGLKTDGYYMGLTCLQNYGYYVQQTQFEPTTTVGGEKLFGLKTNDAETDFFANSGAKKRSFDMVAWDKTTYPESEIIAYGTNHKDLFNTHSLSLISVTDKSQAEKILKQLTNNEITFEDAVQEFSEKYYSDENGKLTSNYEYQITEILPESDAQAVFSLQKDGLSDVIQAANNSYIIFRCDDAADTSFVVADNVDVVRNYISTHESGIVEEYYLNLAKDFAANAVANGFDKACKDADAEKVAVPAFPLNYGANELYDTISADISDLQGASRNENFLEKAFALKNGEVSEPIVIGNKVLVLKLTGEQTDSVPEEKKTQITQTIARFDANAANSILLASDKVENNVAHVFFNELNR